MIDSFLGQVAVTVVIGITSIVLLYWYSIRNHDYWKKRGISSAPTVPFLGSMHEIFFKTFHDIEEERYKKFGRIYGYYERNKPVLSVGTPELLKKILIKDFAFFPERRAFKTGEKMLDSMLTVVKGEDWKRIRSIITPTFSTGKIKRMTNIIKECSRVLVQHFRTSTESGESVDAKRLFGAFTMDVIASSAFSTKVDSHNDPDNIFVQMVRKIFTKGFNWRFVFFFFAPGLMKLLRIPVVERDSIEFFINATYQIIEERKKTGKSRNDFLQLLMDTAKEVSEEEKRETQDSEKGDITSNYGENDIEQQILKTVTSKHLSMEELVAQCIVFFVVGYETTATTLALTSYNIAINPEIQDRLRKEVDAALKETNGELTYEAIQSMKYLDNVISETLRIYPPLAKYERVTTADYKLGDTGIIVPKGMIVTIPVYAIHRDPDFFPEPEKFDPDRFTPEERGNREQCTYMPFGAGPRNCVAMRFALMEIKICLAHVIANFVIKRCPETQVPLEFSIIRGLLQPKSVIFELEIREDCPLVK